MKPIVAVLFALVALVLAMNYVDATICAKDLRSGNPQNFNSIDDMYAENGRGGAYVYQHEGPC